MSSNIVHLGEHIYQLPPMPKTKADILFHQQKPVDQFWLRQTDFPKEFYDYNPLTLINQKATRYNDDGILVTLSVEDTAELRRLRDRELMRRINGIWFFNNGQPTYMTGSYYFVLQWGAMVDMVGDVNPNDGSEMGCFRVFQNNFFYFWDLCKKDPHSAGGIVPKPKKSGLTQLVAIDFLEESTRLKNKRFGMMSKSFTDAKDTNFMYYKYALDHLPYIFRPMISNETQSRIKFDMPRAKHTGSQQSKMRALDNSSGYNTEVFAAPSKPDAFDGPKMYRVMLDEIFKYDKPASPNQVWDASKETTKMQHLITGKILAFGYPPEDDSDEFMEAIQLYKESKLKTKDAVTERTMTELYAYYIPSSETSEGSHDKYGFADVNKNKLYLMAKRKQLAKNPRALQAYIREYSLTEEEVFRMGGSGGAPFNTIRLGKRVQELEDDANAGNIPYVEGHFKWRDRRFGLVDFVPLTEEQVLAGEQDKFRIYHPEWFRKEWINATVINNLRDSEGHLKASDTSICVGAIDPTEFTLKTDVRAASNNAITGFLLDDSETNTQFGRKVTNRFMLDYLYRPDDPEEFLEDCYMTTLYFGMYMMPEANKAWVITKYKLDKLHNFLLVRTADNQVIPLSAKQEKTKLPNTVNSGGVNVIDELCRAINNYTAEPKSTPGLETGFDNMPLIDSVRMLDDWIIFKPEDTRKYDLTMCSGLNLIAANGLAAYRSRVPNERFDSALARRVFTMLNPGMTDDVYGSTGYR